jgi:hypothetical protein
MKGKGLLFALLLVVYPLVAPAPAPAATIAQWNFNSAPPDGSTSTGTNLPSVGVGTAVLIGGTTATYAAGSTNDPATSADDSGWNTSHYPAQSTGNKTAGVQFNVSTLSYSNIVVRWDHKVSSSASKCCRLQYSTDGVNFTDYATPIFSRIISSTGSYYEAQTNSLAAIPGVENNAYFAFRIVSEFEDTATGAGTNGYVTTYGTNNYGTSGTIRFDLVTVTGTLIPGANTPPTISTISNQTIRVDHSTDALAFTIGDAEDPVSSLTLAKLSSDPSVIPESSIALGGSGANRTVTVSAGGQLGTSIITLYVTDTGSRSNSMSFAVTVWPLNTAPTITGIPASSTLLDTATAALGFTVADFETPAASLLVSGSSANPAVVPDANIVFGGSGADRTATVTPAPGQAGVAPITITVSDGTNAASTVFPLMVLPSPQVVFYEPFSYPDGSLLTNSAFLWAHDSGSIEGECQTTNGQLQVTAAQAEDVVGDLVGGPFVRSNSTVLYASFKLRALSLPKNTPDYFAHFVGSANRGRVYAGTTNAGSGSFRLFVGNGTTTDDPIMLGTDLNLDTTYTVVTRYDIDAATTKLWLNPAAESDPGVTATDVQSAVTISSYGFRQSTSVGASVLVDDLLVGLSFAAVLPSGTGVTRIPISIERTGNQVILSWSDPAFVLQSAPSPTGTFTNIPGAASRFTNTIGAGRKFFRLKAN